MLLRRLLIGLTCVGLLGSPVATLACPTADPAAMACCQQDANDCNQRGKSDDCCRTLPGDGQTAATAAKASDIAGAQLNASPAAMLPATTLMVELPDAFLPARKQHRVHDHSPPPLSVLRI